MQKSTFTKIPDLEFIGKFVIPKTDGKTNIKDAKDVFRLGVDEFDKLESPPCKTTPEIEVEAFLITPNKTGKMSDFFGLLGNNPKRLALTTENQIVQFSKDNFDLWYERSLENKNPRVLFLCNQEKPYIVYVEMYENRLGPEYYDSNNGSLWKSTEKEPIILVVPAVR
ncbi:MAG TPA: hypothetical protein VG694_03215 [Candidatus Paceibacterota bacterium]|nr:hypothetical protein [Candidatus Paceibacterota bacterium]